MKNYRELIVWQKSMALVTVVYPDSANFPVEETYSLTNQIISVPSNIAEGFGRNHTKEYIRFLEISRGSLCELQTQLEIAFNLKFIPQEDFEQIAQKSLEI